MASQPNRHLDDERLDGYALSRLDEAATAECEEHLLVCEACRERLDQTEAFVAGIRTAAPRREERRPWFAAPGWRWAWAGTLALAAATLLLMTRIGEHSPAPVAVVLEATRGEGSPAAPEGTPVVLKPDLAGLAAAATYPLELVDSAGAVRWRGNAGGSHPQLTVPGMNAGAYFVRVYSPSRQLLREYALRIGR